MRRLCLAGLLVLAVGCKKNGASITEPECRITGVTVSQLQFTMTVGQTVDVQAAVAQSGCPSLPAVAFTSSDQAVVTVSGTGTVSAVGVGTATVTAQIVGRSEKATAQVTVVGRVLSLTLAPDSSAVPVTGTVQLTPTLAVDPGTSTGLDWSSADPAKATVSGTGLVTGVAAGTVVITVKSTADPTKSATAKVTVVPRVTGVVVDPVRDTILVVETLPINATVSGDPGVVTTVTWRSSNPAVATVAAAVGGGATPSSSVFAVAGTITAVGAGTAEITAIATADTTRQATATIVVLPRVFGITVNPPTASVVVAATQALTATVTGDPGVVVDVTWSTSDPAKATVSGTGVVTAVAVGTAVITARSVADPTKAATATITVTQPAPPQPPPVAMGNLCFGQPDNGGGGNESPPAAPSMLLASPQCPTEVALDVWLSTVQVQGYLASTGAAALTTLVNSNFPTVWPVEIAPGLWDIEGNGAGTANLDFTLIGNPAVKARIKVRVVSAAQTICMSLTLGGPCATGVTVKVGQSVTVYARNASAQPVAARWLTVPTIAEIPYPFFFDNKVTITGKAVGVSPMAVDWTATESVSWGAIVTVIP